MKIAVVGTGNLGRALASAWDRTGHQIMISGRSLDKATAIAKTLGPNTRPMPMGEAITNAEVILLAISWSGFEEVLNAVGAANGALKGKILIDPINPVEHGIGILLSPSTDSVAQRISNIAVGARVVKAFNMFPASQWQESTSDETKRPIVVMCGNNAQALDIVSELAQDAGGQPAILGSIERSRQLEETAGFVIGLAFSGFDPSRAVPGF